MEKSLSSTLPKSRSAIFLAFLLSVLFAISITGFTAFADEPDDGKANLQEEATNQPAGIINDDAEVGPAPSLPPDEAGIIPGIGEGEDNEDAEDLGLAPIVVPDEEAPEYVDETPEAEDPAKQDDATEPGAEGQAGVDGVPSGPIAVPEVYYTPATYSYAYDEGYSPAIDQVVAIEPEPGTVEPEPTAVEPRSIQKGSNEPELVTIEDEATPLAQGSQEAINEFPIGIYVGIGLLVLGIVASLVVFLARKRINAS